MNILEGEIKAILSEKTLSVLEIDISGVFITGIVLDTELSSSYLTIGNSISIFFKETEVILSKTKDIQLSINNILPCVVKKISVGAILTEVSLVFNGQTIKSIAPTKNCLSLNLKENEHIFALINYTDIILSSAHD